MSFRALARRSKDVNQSRRLLSLAAVRDGMDRGSAVKIGGAQSIARAIHARIYPSHIHHL